MGANYNWTGPVSLLACCRDHPMSGCVETLLANCFRQLRLNMRTQFRLLVGIQGDSCDSWAIIDISAVYELPSAFQWIALYGQIQQRWQEKQIEDGNGFVFRTFLQNGVSTYVPTTHRMLVRLMLGFHSANGQMGGTINVFGPVPVFSARLFGTSKKAVIKCNWKLSSLFRRLSCEANLCIFAPLPSRDKLL